MPDAGARGRQTEVTYILTPTRVAVTGITLVLLNIRDWHNRHLSH